MSMNVKTLKKVCNVAGGLIKASFEKTKIVDPGLVLAVICDEGFCIGSNCSREESLMITCLAKVNPGLMRCFTPSDLLQDDLEERGYAPIFTNMAVAVSKAMLTLEEENEDKVTFIMLLPERDKALDIVAIDVYSPMSKEDILHALDVMITNAPKEVVALLMRTLLLKTGRLENDNENGGGRGGKNNEHESKIIH